VIDFAAELTAWLRSADARTLMTEIVAEAVQTEMRGALEEELIDVVQAAAMLSMTEAHCERRSSADRWRVSASVVACGSVARICCVARGRLRLPHRDRRLGSALCSSGAPSAMRSTAVVSASSPTGRAPSSQPAPNLRAASERTSGARSDRKIAS
jgi:hypothetical protein